MKKHFPIVLLLVCAAAFAFGLARLFQLRFEVGDVYPGYSSLRSDPLGTMAFYESLEKLPGFSARRDYSTANRLPEGKGAVYLHLAASPREWRWLPEETFREIERFLGGGGRLVITMFPQPAEEFFRSTREVDGADADPADDKPAKDEKLKDAKPKEEQVKDGKTPAPAKPKKKKMSPGDDEPEVKLTSVEERWGVDFSVIKLTQGPDDVYEPARVSNRTDLPLPDALDWHSGIVCTNLNQAWQTVYARGTNAVVIERKFGRGSVVIATDSFFLSNEAMLKDRHAELLAWLIGSGKTVVFDEAHLGVTESPGVAGLMRKYRLHGLAAGLLILAGLFIWKNSASLVPPHAEEEAQGYVAGKDAAAGFVNLLRRSIAPRDLLATCFTEWKKSAAQTGKHSAARLQQAEAVFQAENSLGVSDRHPVRAYQAISRILQTRNLKPEAVKPFVVKIK